MDSFNSTCIYIAEIREITSTLNIRQFIGGSFATDHPVIGSVARNRSGVNIEMHQMTNTFYPNTRCIITDNHKLAACKIQSA